MRFLNTLRKVGVIALLAMLTALGLVACGSDTATAVPAATTAAMTSTTAAMTGTTASMPATTAAMMTATTAAMTGTTMAGTTAAMTGTTGAMMTATTAAAMTGTTAAVTGASSLKLGLVTDIGRLDDKSFNASSWLGVQTAAKALGVTPKAIETTSPSDYAKNIETLADGGYNVIVTVGFLMQDATTAEAAKYPNVKFIGVDQAYDNKAPANLAGLIFNEDQSGFLAGALAAGMSKKHNIASVLGLEAVPSVKRFGDGFKAGAAYFDKNYATLTGNSATTVNLIYHPASDNAFTDPAWGGLQATTFIQNGADVIFGAGGNTGNGAVQTGAKAGAYVIGVDTDQYLTLGSDPTVGSKMLSSATKSLADGVQTIIQSIAGGTFKGGGNIKGKVALAPFHDTDSLISADLKAALVKINAGLLDGSITTGVAAS